MNLKKSLNRILCGLALSLVLLGCAATDNRESTGEYIDSAVLTSKVKAQLVKNEKVSALDVKVKTYKGRVQLSGFVDSWEEKLIAGSVASNVQGVLDVENDIEVK